MHKIAQTAN